MEDRKQGDKGGSESKEKNGGEEVKRRTEDRK